MVATGYREARSERAHARLITAHRVDLTLWCHRSVAWCLRRTVRRGWSVIPPPVPVERPLYSIGTQARIERLRASCPAAGYARPAQASQAFWWEAAGRRQL
jgi:hypothetical protein